MPSETPHMPNQTYKKLLNHGASKGLGLLAGEVAWYPNPNDVNHKMVRYAKRIGITLLATMAVALFIGIKSSV